VISKIQTCVYVGFNNRGQNSIVKGMDLNGDHDLSFCDGCVYGKHHRTPFPLSEVFMQRKFLGLCTQTYVVPWQHFMEGKNILKPSLMISLGKKFFIS
jgi:hypothetical protein